MGDLDEAIHLRAYAHACAVARAEVDVVKIPKGAGGVGFLPLDRDGGEEAGRGGGPRRWASSSRAEYIQLGGPSVVNDMLLSGAAHFAAAGPPAFITMWDKTAQPT